MLYTQTDTKLRYKKILESNNRCLTKSDVSQVEVCVYGYNLGFVLQELGELALSYRICLHVDLCLGGFVLPFARKLGYTHLVFVSFHCFC